MLLELILTLIVFSFLLNIGFFYIKSNQSVNTVSHNTIDYVKILKHFIKLPKTIEGIFREREKTRTFCYKNETYQVKIKNISIDLSNFIDNVEVYQAELWNNEKKLSFIYFQILSTTKGLKPFYQVFFDDGKIKEEEDNW